MHTSHTGGRYVTPRNGKRLSLSTLIITVILIISLMVNMYCMMYHTNTYQRTTLPTIPTHMPHEDDYNDHVDHCHGCEQTICPECPAVDATCGERLITVEHNLVGALAKVADLRTRVINGAECPTIPPPVPCPACPTSTSNHPTDVITQTDELPYLIIGINTVSRTDPTKDYLNPTLDSLVSQLPSDPNDTLFARVHIWVMNHNYPQTNVHAVFELAKKRFSGHACRCVFFYNNPGLYPNPPPGSPVHHGSANQPGSIVQKQTRDIVSLARTALRKSQHYMFMEDDFILCPNGIRMIHYFMRRAYQYSSNWLSLKMCFGMNGFLLRNNEDLETFIDYLLKRIADRPPDHVQVEWSCGEKPEAKAYVGDRAHMTYRYNLFYHIGRTSSLREVEQGDYSKCYEPLDTTALFPVDAFDARQCGHDDIMPCPPPHVNPPQIPFSTTLQPILPDNLAQQWLPRPKPKL